MNLTNHFNFGQKGIPHPDKVDKGGEDAYSGSENLLVVADGVGGWASHGVDPGLYSKELVVNVNKLYAEDSEKYRKNPK
jgi:serine/threonine protein phosphatase PrpC